MLESVFNKVYLKETPAQVFSGEVCESFKNICGRLFLRILQEKLLNSTTKSLHFNVYRRFKFSTVGSVSQHGTLQQVMSTAASLYMTQLHYIYDSASLYMNQTILTKSQNLLN